MEFPRTFIKIILNIDVFFNKDLTFGLITGLASFDNLCIYVKVFFCIKKEPCCDKNRLFTYAKTKAQISCAITDQSLCFRYIASTIPLLPKYEISSI